MNKESKKRIQELLEYALPLAQCKAEKDTMSTKFEKEETYDEYEHASSPSEYELEQYEELENTYEDNEAHFLALAEGVFKNLEEAKEVFNHAYTISLTLEESVPKINTQLFKRTFIEACARKLEIQTQHPFSAFKARINAEKKQDLQSEEKANNTRPR